MKKVAMIESSAAQFTEILARTTVTGQLPVETPPPIHNPPLDAARPESVVDRAHRLLRAFGGRLRSRKAYSRLERADSRAAQRRLRQMRGKHPDHIIIDDPHADKE